MKKIILVVLCATTCMATISCGNNSGSGNRTNSEITEVDTSIIQLPSSQVVDSVKKEVSGSFTPVEIQVTEPVENKNAIIGEGIEGYEYTAEIFFIDSTGDEYSIKLYATIHPIEYVDKKEDQEWHKNEVKELEKTKGVFKSLTASKPSDFYITYNSSEMKLGVYRKEKITNKKIGNAVIRESDPEPIWAGYFNKKPGRKPMLIYAGTEGVTNASNSNE